MAAPIKFKAVFPKVRIVSRCASCQKVIPDGRLLCSGCEKAQRKSLGFRF